MSYPVVVRSLPLPDFQTKGALEKLVTDCLLLNRLSKEREGTCNGLGGHGGSAHLNSLGSVVNSVYCPLAQYLLKTRKVPHWRKKPHPHDVSGTVKTSVKDSYGSLCDAVVDFKRKDDAESFSRTCETEQHFPVDILWPVFSNMECQVNEKLSSVLLGHGELCQDFRDKSGIKVDREGDCVVFVGKEWQIEIAKYRVHLFLEQAQSQKKQKETEDRRDLNSKTEEKQSEKKHPKEDDDDREQQTTKNKLPNSKAKTVPAQIQLNAKDIDAVVQNIPILATVRGPPEFPDQGYLETDEPFAKSSLGLLNYPSGEEILAVNSKDHLGESHEERLRHDEAEEVFEDYVPVDYGYWLYIVKYETVFMCDLHRFAEDRGTSFDADEKNNLLRIRGKSKQNIAQAKRKVEEAYTGFGFNMLQRRLGDYALDDGSKLKQLEQRFPDVLFLRSRSGQTDVIGQEKDVLACFEEVSHNTNRKAPHKEYPPEYGTKPKAAEEGSWVDVPHTNPKASRKECSPGHGSSRTGAEKGSWADVPHTNPKTSHQACPAGHGTSRTVAGEGSRVDVPRAKTREWSQDDKGEERFKEQETGARPRGRIVQENAPRTDAMSMTSGFVKTGFLLFEATAVFIHRTDITKMHVDAIVNAANESLKHGGGIAEVIAQKAGPELHRDCEDIISRNGKLVASEVVVTSAGTLPCHNVMHAVGPRWKNHEARNCLEALDDTFRNIMFTSRKYSFKSIAIPPISSGIFQVPIEYVVRAMVKEVIDGARSGTTLESIHLVDLEETTLQLVVREFVEHLQRMKLGHITQLDEMRVRQSIARYLPTLPKFFQLRSHAKVLVYICDITQVRVDAMTCPAIVAQKFYSGLNFIKTGALKAIDKAAGPLMKKERDEIYSMKNKKMEAGQVFPTSAGGNLRCKRIYHAVPPEWPSTADNKSKDRAKEVLQLMYTSVLLAAKEAGHESIAFPPIGGGKKGIPPDVVAKALSKSLVEVLGEARQLREVHIVDLKDDILVLVSRELGAYAGAEEIENPN